MFDGNMFVYFLGGLVVNCLEIALKLFEMMYFDYMG
jgi:hypothetical protein